jgi:hypothetical protein
LRIPSFQANHGTSSAGEFEHQVDDALLGNAVRATALSYVAKPSRGRGKPKDGRGHQFIVQDRVRHAKEPQSFNGEQFRIARSCAN